MASDLENALKVVFAGIGIIVVALWVASLPPGPATSVPAPAYTPTATTPTAYTPNYRSERDRRIDAFVDSQIDSQWRPLPGGNSKEDAARVTKDILKARTWDELDRTIEFHSREGR